jgi:MFS family permease
VQCGSGDAPGEEYDMSDRAKIKFGPAQLQDGIATRNAWGLMYASFVTIGLATGIAVLTPYILTTNLGIGQGDQGKALGTLAIAQELALLIAFAMFGAMADKIGRRTVYVIGMVLLTIAYGVFAYGGSMTELALYRVIFAFGIGAATGMLATVISDYAVVEDRGKLTALCGFLNGLGVVVVAIFLGKLPVYFVGLGQSEVEAGRSAMAVVAGVALLSATVLWMTLKPGVPPATDSKKTVSALLREGVTAARENRRIAISYCAAFVARGDIAIVGLFTIAWGNQAAIAQGYSAAEAVSKGNFPFVIAQSTALLWPAVIAVPLDRMDRMKALSLSMLLGLIGYCALVMVDSPLSGMAIPFFMMLGIGQISAFLGAQTIIGKEAPEAVRGSVIGLFNFCGALGILILTGIGGWLFDHVAPWAPFFLVGVLNGVVAIMCWLQYRSEQAAQTV